MKKMLKSLLPFAFCLLPFATHAATAWWLQPTVCKPNPTTCYVSMGAGFDDQMWDARANCRGLKYVCPGALTANPADPVLMGKMEIAARTGINSDFDTDVLNAGCFGARKLSNNETQASVDGKYVNIWCSGVLDNADETVVGGEITFGAAPTCANLSDRGYAGILNKKCYGKYYNPSDYYIECGDELAPTRLVKLNGADAITGDGMAPSYPTDAPAAKSLFDQMYEISAARKAERF